MPGERDLLGEIGGRIDALPERHVVIGQEHDAQPAPDIGIVIDHLSDRVHQLDDQLRHEIAGRGLAAEQESARNHCAAGLLDAVIESDDVQDFEMLPLVLVNALHHDVEHARPDRQSFRSSCDVVDKLPLHGMLRFVPFFAKGGIGGIRLQVSKLVQIFDPFVADARADQLRRGRGFASASQRRGVTPLVLLLKRSGYIS